MHLRVLAFALFSSLIAGHAAQTASFTVHLTDPRYSDAAAIGELTLSNKILSFNVPLPKIGAWMGMGMGTASSPILWHNPFIRCDSTTNGVCLLLNDFHLTDKQTTEVLNGLWEVVLIAIGGDVGGPLVRIDMRGRILPVDTDNDGVSDYFDDCPDTPAGSVVNAHGCGIEQLCPCDGPWKSRGHYLKTVVTVTQEFVANRLITPRERNAILRAAVNSHCGWRRRR